MSDKQRIETARDQGQGVLRLTPTCVPRSFCIPARRLRLHPDDYYCFGANRGSIDERWFTSTSKADNGPLTTSAEGLSYVYVEDGSHGARVLFKDALELLGGEILSREVLKEARRLGDVQQVLRQPVASAAPHPSIPTPTRPPTSK